MRFLLALRFMKISKVMAITQQAIASIPKGNDILNEGERNIRIAAKTSPRKWKDSAHLFMEECFE